MIGDTAMILQDTARSGFTSAEDLPVDPDAIRLVNEKTAIICGMADLLLDANGSLDHEVGRAALDSIKRHAADLRELFKQN